MSAPADDIDQPTVTRLLRPRPRKGPVEPEAPAEFGGLGEEPTVVVRRPPAAAQEPPPEAPEVLKGATSFLQQLEPTRERLLVRAAAPLLLIVAQLRTGIERADVTALRQVAIEEIERFEERAEKAGVEAGDIIAARYVLCSVVDEAVLMTPWGSHSDWRANSLLNRYHNESWGGEKVFRLLDRIRTSAERKIQLLVLVHTCLMLGFEGRYRVIKQGREQLEDLRNDVSRLVRRYSLINPDEPLSPNVPPPPRRRRFPFWLAAAAGAAVLILLLVSTETRLSSALTHLMRSLSALVSG